MSIPFTDREMEKAWREHKSFFDNSSEKQRKNVYRYGKLNKKVIQSQKSPPKRKNEIIFFKP
ncbi:MAG: hypothetical protein AAFS12_08885 [Cyanobacteria bacterium J06632_19]